MIAEQTAGKDERRRLDDEELVREGERALVERLGVAGMVRFLRLVAGGRDRFEEIRAEWQDMTMDETLEAMGVPPQGER